MPRRRIPTNKTNPSTVRHGVEGYDATEDREIANKEDTSEFRKRLKKAHHKYFADAKKRKKGTYTATDTGARALAERRKEYHSREAKKVMEAMERRDRNKKMA